MATPRPINENTLKSEYARITSQIRSYLQHVENFHQQLADLKTRAVAGGLAKTYSALESPPVIRPRVEEPTLRARVLESFSGQWRGRPYDAPAGTVADFPASYVKHATTLFERVDPATPLYRPALQPEWPRDVAIPAARPGGWY